MGITSFHQANMPHLTSMVLLCLAFIAANASGPTMVMLERMQTKSKAGGVDWFDLAIFLVFEVGIIGSTILAFRSKAFPDYQEEKKKIDTALLAKGTTEGDHATILG